MLVGMIPATALTANAITADDLVGSGTADDPYRVGSYAELFAAEKAYKDKNEKLYVYLTAYLSVDVNGDGEKSAKDSNLLKQIISGAL